MSRILAGTDIQSLADCLIGAAADQVRAGDPFQPLTIVVPHRHLQRWLQLRLARCLGVAINVRFRFLETALWEMLAEIDAPSRHAHPPELLPDEEYRLLVLSALLEGPDDDLESLRHYVFRDRKDLDRRSCRRAWQLADRLSSLIRDYEYHRQEEFILPWLHGKFSPLSLEPQERETERGQRAVFRSIIEEVHGARTRLNRAAGRNFKTLPQYAGEIEEFPPPFPKHPIRIVHLFGITQVSALHVAVLGRLAGYYDLRIYFPHPMAHAEGLQPGNPGSNPEKEWRRRAADFRKESGHGQGVNLLRAWGRAGAESIDLAARLLKPSTGIDLEAVAPTHAEDSQGPDSVLARVQAHLQGKLPPENNIPQDATLQIVPCPGILREVETVFWSIVHNLRRDPTLRATEIAVLAVDLPSYRPVLQAVFDRHPELVPYDLADYSAAGTSLYGQAALAMLDLALETFTRSGVLHVLQNPCFLARLGAEPDQVKTWMHWADRLGIYQGWDGEDRKDRRKGESPPFSWRSALRRLRLGRFMAQGVSPNNTPRFGNVVPHADLESSDGETLDVFCRAVEDLLPFLTRLRNLRTSGTAWRNTLEKLFDRFLRVPSDRPAEAYVRDRLLADLQRLEHLDHIAAGTESLKLPLALVREMVASGVRNIPAGKGDPGCGGVALSSLGSARLVPFRIVYLLGMNEGIFPGSDSLSTLDLRRTRRTDGDIRPAELNRFLLLESILATRDKLYLTYPERHLQDDGKLLPAVPLTQLRRFVEDRVLGADFRVPRVPLVGHDPATLHDLREDPAIDVVAQYDPLDRHLALEIARSEGRVRFGPDQERKHGRASAGILRRFEFPPITVSRERGPRTLPLSRLADFLKNPARVALDRIVKGKEEDPVDICDDEPFTAPSGTARELIREVLTDSIREASLAKGFGTDQEYLKILTEGWSRSFAERYELEGLRSRLPQKPFDSVDRRALGEEISRRLAGDTGLISFVERRHGDSFLGPILLGESLTPIGARTKVPALELQVPDPRGGGTPIEIRLVGSWDLAWSGEAGLELLTVRSGKPSEADLPFDSYSLEGMLFHLALLAQENTATGKSATGPHFDRGCRVHVAGPDGVESYFLGAGAVTPDEARSYLASLAADFLDPFRFDMLPLKIMIEKGFRDHFFQALNGTYQGDAESFRNSLQEEVDETVEEGRNVWWWSPMFDLMQVVVPGDALETVARRFALPARFRCLNSDEKPVAAETKPPEKSPARRRKGKKQA